jgi:hypothetical protein
VYDVDSDTFTCHDLGNEKIPVSIFWDLKDHRYFGVQVEASKTVMSKETETTEDSENDADTEQGEDDNDEKEKVTTREFLTFFYTT